VLEGLYASALEDSRLRQQNESIAALEVRALNEAAALPALDFLAKRQNIRVLAEIKRASPSRGDLAEIRDAAALAKTYAEFGASAISVLTETKSFKGSLEDLRAVRQQVDIPILRKDFISTKYQVLEARAAGADIVLLIVAGLTQEQLVELKNFTEQLGMTAFVETHNSTEIKQALDVDAKLIGINARDLSTFHTDRSLFATLRELIPENVVTVAESAVRNVDDVRNYRNAGADVVLVGEALVSGDAKTLLREFTSV
jgi:indole-3-glycerol phosphate synthase